MLNIFASLLVGELQVISIFQLSTRFPLIGELSICSIKETYWFTSSYPHPQYMIQYFLLTQKPTQCLFGD